MLILNAFFEDYFVNNYVLLVMLGGMLLLTVHDVYLENRALVWLRLTIAAIFVLSLFEYFEECYSAQAESSNWRILFSALCYTLRPAIIMMIMFSIHKRVSLWITVPAIINMLVVFSAFFTDIAFSFTSDNYFIRGPLGYLPYFVSAFYLLVLIILSIRSLSRNTIREQIVVFFIGLAAVGAALLSLFAHDWVVIPTYAAGMLLYYLFTYEQYTKRDALTGLLNRQSFYSDIDKYDNDVRGVISIDMNELKWLNDNYGHAAGDKALAVVSECFLKCVTAAERVYRVGGDEFVVLSKRGDPDYLSSLMEQMRAAVDDTEYSCAFGYSEGRDAEDMVREADERMLADKAAIKERMHQEGRTIHFRD